MNQSEFIASLEKIVEISPGSLKPTDQLASFDSWDSLALMQFIALVDKDLGLRLEGGKVAKCKSVQDLLNLVGEVVQG